MKKSTLIALAVFGALALAFLFTREGQVSEGVHRLTLRPVAADALVFIEVGGATPVTLEARDGGWTVAAGGAKGPAFAADVGLAQGLARTLAELQAPDFVTDRADRQAELEVDAAKGVPVKASTAGGVVRDLVVGKASKSGGAYVRAASSSEVFSARGPLSHEVRRALRDWRDKRIPTAPAAEVVRVQVEPTVGVGFTVVKDGAWKLQGAAPADFRFDPDAAQRLVGQLASLTAQDFVSGEAAVAASAAPETTLTLTLGAGATRVLHLGPTGADGTSPLRIDGEAQRWLLPTWQADLLRKDLEGLRDLKVLRFEPQAVERLTVQGAKGRAVVAREGGQWKLVEPKAPPAGFAFEPAQVDAQLGRLGGVRALRVAAGVPAGKAALKAPTVELALKGGAKVTLAFGAEAGAATEVYAKGSDALVWVVPSAQRGWLEGGVELFKKPPPPPPGRGISGLDQLPPDVRAKLEAQLRQRAQ
jgi:Domain of unknown function (DUF4340)